MRCTTITVFTIRVIAMVIKMIMIKILPSFSYNFGTSPELLFKHCGADDKIKKKKKKNGKCDFKIVEKLVCEEGFIEGETYWE